MSLYNSDLYKEMVRKQLAADFVWDRIKQHVSERLIRLGEIFWQKQPAHAAAFSGIEMDIVNAYSKCAAEFCLLTFPQKITVDLTDDASVFFTLRYNDQVNAYHELFFEPEAQEPVQHNVNISAHKNLVFAYSGKFDHSIQAFLDAMLRLTQQN